MKGVENYWRMSLRLVEVNPKFYLASTQMSYYCTPVTTQARKDSVLDGMVYVNSNPGHPVFYKYQMAEGIITTTQNEDNFC